MDCPSLRFKNCFVDVTVQKPQREQQLEVWSTRSSELGMFVTRNVLGGRRRRRKLWRPYDRRSSRVQKRRNVVSVGNTAFQSPLCGKPCGSYCRKRFITSIILNLRTMWHLWPRTTISMRQFKCTEERWQLCLDMEGNHVEQQWFYWITVSSYIL